MVALWTHNASAFALLGPKDTWQVSALGYDPQGDNGDIGGPKNLGEEWRWNIPVITYGFDQSFINFFGTNGMNAVTNAMFLFNREMTNFTALSNANLQRKPTATRRVHETARALGIWDVKSTTMGFLAEQLGLASAERWTWALRSRNQITPTATNYFVVQRNFDPFTSFPTPYVNNTRFSYQIHVFPQILFSADFEAASTFPVDASPAISGSVSSTVGEDFTTIPNLRLHAGEYFEALTRDDIAGLRYIYRASNVNLEDTINNTFVAAINTGNLITTNGLDAFTFFTNALLTNPTNLMNLFPGLLVSSNVTATITNLYTTNYFLTNIPSAGLKTNRDLGILITNLDLYVFSEASRTNRADLLRAIPGYGALIITNTNTFFVNERTPVVYLTNLPSSFPGDPPTLATNYVTNTVINYQYGYANLITNYWSPVTDLELVTISPPPNGNPNDLTLQTNISFFRTNKVSGGFYILDRTTNANLVAYSFEDTNGVPLVRSTNLIDFSSTNLISQSTNVFGLVQSAYVANRFTNVVYSAWPVTIGGIEGAILTNSVTSTQLVRFNYNFDIASLIAGTNSSFGNLLYFPPANGSNLLTVQTISFTNGVRSITETQIPSPVPMGTVLILDTNQFVLTTNRVDLFGLATNTIISFTNAATGDFITQLVIYQTNTIIFGVNPILLQSAAGQILRPGVDSLQFRPIKYQDFLNQGAATTTNFYTALSLNGTNITSSVFRRVAGPDIVFFAGDLGVDTGGRPFLWSRNFNIQPTPGAAAVSVASQRVDGGPGLIVPSSTMRFSTLFPYVESESPNNTREDESAFFGGWGSFDGSTVVPRLYPEDITSQATRLEQLEEIALRRNVSP